MSSTKYRLFVFDIVIRTSDGASIPPNPDNRDYREYLDWLKAGNVPDPYIEPPTPIPTVTRAQALLWLLSVGKTDDDVMKAIASLPDPEIAARAEIEWKYRPIYHRGNPMFDQLGAVLGLTPEQLDAAFIAASKL